MFTSLKSKMIIPIFAILLLLVAFIVVFVSVSTRNLSDALTEERILASAQTAIAYLRSLEDTNRMSARVIASSGQLDWFVRSWNAGVADPLRHRQMLNAYLNGRKAELGVTSFVVVDVRGNVILRTHDFDTYGDPAAERVPDIYNALHYGTVSTTYSSTSAMAMGLSSVAPILEMDNSIGTITAILQMDTVSFIDDFARAFNAEVSVFTMDGTVAMTTVRDEGNNRTIGMPAAPEVIDMVITQGEHYRTMLPLYGVPHHAYYFPLHGWDENPVGMFFVGFSNRYAINATRNMQIILIAMGVIGLAAAALVTLAILLKLLRPLGYLSATAKEVAKGNTSVNFRLDKKDEIGQVSAAFWGVVNSMNILTDNFQQGESAIKHGQLLFRLKDSRLEGVFDEILSRTNAIIQESNTIFEMLTEPILIVNKDFKLLYANHAMRELTDSDGQEYLGVHIDDFLHGSVAAHPAVTSALSMGVAQVDVEIQMPISRSRDKDLLFTCIPIRVEQGNVGLILLISDITDKMDADRRGEKRSSYRHERTDKLTDTIISAFDKGNLDIDIERSPRDDDTEDIAERQDAVEAVVRKATGTIKGYVDEITAILREIADNNFDISISRDYIGDFGSIKSSIKMITEAVSSLVEEIQCSAAQVEKGSDDISQSAHGLMANFEEQATAMSEVREAVTNLTEKTRKTAEDAGAANGLSEEVQKAAAAGAEHMNEMSAAMEEIKISSGEIAKVVGIIENIAFQTNLLALNASVEAARAGEHGRGFAVVAEEVRNLAGRSAAAAKETSEMLATSLTRVDIGASRTQQTAEALDQIVKIAENVANVVASIAQVSNEQADEIGRIHQSMDTIYAGTMGNAETVENNASISQQLTEQSGRLMSLVGKFKIRKK